ncbi:MAG: FHA domain-containing protein [Actinomycetota bacterium]|nr:FHA domain-containing protein [Actinomycetota bacterium]
MSCYSFSSSDDVLLATEVSVLARDLSSCIVASQSATSELERRASAKSLREKYLEIVELPNCRALFEECARALAGIKTQQPSATLRIQYDGPVVDTSGAVQKRSGSGARFMTRTDTFDHQSVVLIGRHSACDVRIASQDAKWCSRVHALVFVVGERMLVVDVGSINGVQTRAREHWLTQLGSTSWADGRCVLEFDRDEGVELTMGQARVVLNAQKCCVCHSAARDCLTSCSHWVACHACVAKVTACPACGETLH